MPHKNEALYHAVKTYIPVAIDFWINRREVSEIRIAQGMDGFQWARILARSDLAELPEYQKCLEELRSDSVIARHLGAYVGTPLGGSSLPDAENYMDYLLDLGMQGDRYVFDEEYFEAAYNSLEEVFYSDEIWFEAVAYLQGLMIDKSARLSDDLELSLLTENEINNSPSTKTRKMSGDPKVNQLCAVRTWYSLEKIVGEHSPSLEEADQARKIQLLANERIDEVINALRLAKIENVYYHVIFHRASDLLPIAPFSFQSRFLGEPSLWFQQGGEWVDWFREFWLDLQHAEVRRRKFLGVAISRFSYGHERHRLEDRVLDLFIAAEALFISEDGNTGEITHRLSERAALFIGGSDTALCKHIFQFMKTAYGLRSTIAHGKIPKAKKLPNKPDRSKMNLEEFVWTIHEYMRIAIHKAIKLAIQPSSPESLVDWEDLLFSRKEENA
jgi:hypothetical protein